MPVAADIPEATSIEPATVRLNYFLLLLLPRLPTYQCFPLLFVSHIGFSFEPLHLEITDKFFCKEIAASK